MRTSVRHSLVVLVALAGATGCHDTPPPTPDGPIAGAGDAGTDAVFVVDQDGDGVPDVDDCAPADATRQVLLEDGGCVADDLDDDDDGVQDLADCAPRDPARQLALLSGLCVADDGDADDDLIPDAQDCAPLDVERQILLLDGSCTADDADDDDDGVADAADCAPVDPLHQLTLVDGTCVADDDDDDDDGALDATDCAPLDPAVSVALSSGVCSADDEDDDDDGIGDVADCAPLDGTRWLVLTTGVCVADDDDDDEDGVEDVLDCAALDPTRSLLLLNGTCVANDGDDDNDGTGDALDCAPLDATLEITLATGGCVVDDADDDNDGVSDGADCAPTDATRQVTLLSGGCEADDDDDDNDGVSDATDCAPRHALLQVVLTTGTCVADDSDDDNDGSPDGTDCSPFDPAYLVGGCNVGDWLDRPCGASVGQCTTGTEERVCAANCWWGPWEECSATVAPAVETCGNGVDEDCDGAVDEGCACAPVAVGDAGSFWVPGPVWKMQADPTRCLLYALVTGDPAQIVVIDTSAKAEIARIDLAGPSLDFDIASDGSRLVAAHGALHKLSVIEPPVWSAVEYALPQTGADDVEVASTGLIYTHAVTDIRVVDLAAGSNDRLLGGLYFYGELELSADESSLFFGEEGTDNSKVKRYAVAPDGSVSLADSSPSHTTPFPEAALALSAAGDQVGYAGFLFDADDLQAIRGWAGTSIHGFDATGRFGVNGYGIFDAELVIPVGEFDAYSSRTALLPGDQEVWRWDLITEMLHYANVGEYLDPAFLGRHEWAPLPLDAYVFDALAVDPVRPWIYALDGARREVVIIDRATLAPLEAILVGTTGTDLALDAAGQYLYVGHEDTWGVARIDLDELEYAGWIPAHVRPIDIVALTPGRLAVTGTDQWQKTMLLDGFGGGILDFATSNYYSPALAASPDGLEVYVGERGTTCSTLAVLSHAGDNLVQLRKLTEVTSPTCPEIVYDRSVVTVPGTTDVFWGAARWHTADLSKVYDLADTIRGLTPDGALAFSETQVYAASTGTPLGLLSTSSLVQAVSPDGATLYVAGAAGLTAIDLTPFGP